MAQRHRATRFDRHSGKILIGFLVLLLVLAEGVTRVLARRGHVAYTRFATTRASSFWADVSESFGVWHLPDATFWHGSPCFDATYRSNSYGARDIERARRSDASRRVVVLGDSFVEGYGVDFDARMTSVVEAATGVELLNFGVSGNFGPVQEWLQYESLASTFDHTEVFVFFLPDNDFDDMEPANFPSNRYRPYLREAGDSFEVWYPVAFADRHVPKPRSWEKIARRHVLNNWYLLNAIRYPFEQGATSPLLSDRDCSYRARSQSETARLLFAYDAIVTAAGERPVTIFVVPRLADLERCADMPTADSIFAPLESFAATRPSASIVDLAAHFRKDAQRNERTYAEYFHPCDGHWSELGNRVAADAVMAYLLHERTQDP